MQRDADSASHEFSRLEAAASYGRDYHTSPEERRAYEICIVKDAGEPALSEANGLVLSEANGTPRSQGSLKLV